MRGRFRILDSGCEIRVVSQPLELEWWIDEMHIPGMEARLFFPCMV
jgi:hypothetical protein